MNELSKLIFEKYQIRKTQKQKTAFIDLLKQYYPELKIEEGGFFKNRNIVIGDIDSASIIVTAHYDTCAQLPFPNFIMPKNFLLTLLYSILIAIPFFLLMIPIQLLIMFFFENSFAAYEISYFLVLLAFLWLSMFGKPNKHTANDNTSGVIALCELLERMSPEQCTQTAFVFFDNEEYGLLGSGYFSRLHKKQLKKFLLINMDCISDGDHLLLVINAAARKKYGELFESAFLDSGNKKFYFEKASTTFYPSDQMNFPVNMAVSAMNKKPLIGFYMDKIHTKRDRVFEEENIQCICDGIQSFIQKAANL